jgi:hypothetical protein
MATIVLGMCTHTYIHTYKHTYMHNEIVDMSVRLGQGFIGGFAVFIYSCTYDHFFLF